MATDAAAGRGSLRIYLGVAQGVGSYPLASQARRCREQGRDVVVADADLGDRLRSTALLAGLEHAPGPPEEGGRLAVDWLLRRRPQVVIVDDLARGAAAGGSSVRWRQIETLLAAGIDVLSALDVRHLESLADAVSGLSGHREGDLVPDRVVRQADQVELVDVTPQVFGQPRRRNGIAPSAGTAGTLPVDHRPEVVTALRGLGRRWLADQLDSAPAGDRVVVALTGGPEGESLIRRAARIAGRSAGGELLAVHVGADAGFGQGAPGTLEAQRALCERLGGSFQRVVGEDVASAVIEFAVGAGAALVVIGLTSRSRWRSILSEDVGSQIVRSAADRDLDVLVVAEDSVPPPRRARASVLGRRRRLSGWLVAVLGPVLLVAVSSGSARAFGLTSDLLLVVAVTVAAALIGGLGPAVTSAVLGTLMVNYFLTPPVHTLAIDSPENALGLAVCVLVAVAVSSVVDLAARRAVLARRSAAEAETLSVLAGSVVRGEDTVSAIIEQLRSTFGLRSVALQERNGPGAAWRPVYGSAPEQPSAPRRPTPGDLAPDRSSEASVAVSDRLQLLITGDPLSGADRRVLEAFAAQVAAILERDRLREASRRMELIEAGDEMRRSLLAAVSHDLRTPLAAIKAGVSSLRQSDVVWSEADQQALLAMVDDSGDQLERLIDNLLDVSRLQAGIATPSLRQVSLEEVVWPALRGASGGRVRVELADDLPLVTTDPPLLERALANLIDNALKYSPGDRLVEVRVAGPESAARGADGSTGWV